MLVIEKKQVQNWLAELKEKFQVFDIRNSVLPPKRYFFPPREETFIFNKKTSRLSRPSLNLQKRFVVFGLDLDDLEAMTQMDEIMKKPEPDFYYWQRRKKSFLVGLSDESMPVPPGGDLILEKIDAGRYRALVLNRKGDRLTKSKFFKDIYLSKSATARVRRLSKFKELLLDAELLHDAIKWSRHHKIWDELADKCLGCGNCTYVCPICHCFSTEDRVDLEDRTCVRSRCWDACTLPEFAEVAGGHNFHRTIKERYYNWFYHKFVRAYNEYGRSQCVGCGRCRDNCPAGIDIEEVLTEIVRDYRKSNR